VLTQDSFVLDNGLRFVSLQNFCKQTKSISIITIRTETAHVHNTVFKSVGGFSVLIKFIIFISSGNGGQDTVSKAPPALNTKRWQQLGGSVDSDVQDDKVSAR
jgi:hypothetical protein